MSIRTFRPRAQATLLKNIVRTDGVSRRYRGARTTVDLTPLLGDHGSLTVRKSLYLPMGQWEITLTDQRDLQTQDTLYSMVEPMDGIEIRLAHAPHEYGGELPVLMRGFVTGVRRAESIGGDGRPLRRVVIEGADYGLPFARSRISWRMAAGQAVLANYGELQAVGLDFKPYPAAQFIRDVTERAINPWLDTFYSQSVSNPEARSVAPVARSIAVDASVTDGTVNPYGIKPFERPAWEWMAEHADLAWNEMFIEDREAGPTLVYRPAPFKDLNGDWIPQGSATVGAERVDVEADAIVALDASRSDANVANDFWCYPTSTALIPDTSLRLAGMDEQRFPQNPPNARVELYGLRTMTPPMAQGPTGLGRLDGLPADKQVESADAVTAWATYRQDVLLAFNQDNAVFEDVTLTLRGDERVRPGRYLRIRRGGFEFECYAHAVTHEFLPFQSYLTHVQAIRGTGLVTRSKMQASPYGAEGRRGAYG